MTNEELKATSSQGFTAARFPSKEPSDPSGLDTGLNVCYSIWMIRYKYHFCKKCKEKLPPSHFEVGSAEVSTCKVCKEITKLTKRCNRYAISVVDFLEIYEEQEGRCFSCGLEKSYSDLHIDHCHKKGNVRGLLCVNCNIALGMVKDNKETLSNLIAYLEKQEK